jgi:hypothetical protein
MTTTTMTTTSSPSTTTDTGFLRSLLWASVTIAAVTMVMAVLWTRSA